MGEPVPILPRMGKLDPNGDWPFFFSFSRNGTLAQIPGGGFGVPGHLVWADRNGKIERLPFEPAAINGLGLSPDGNLVAVTRLDAGLQNIWIYDLTRNTAEKMTHSGQNFWARWHPNGDRIGYTSLVKGEYDIRWSALDGSVQEETLLASPFDEALRDWSPDGKMVLFEQYSPEDETEYLWLMDVSDPDSKRVVTSAGAGDWNGVISPDERWVAYVQSGVIKVTSYPDGQGRITVGGQPAKQISEIAWSPSTSEPFFSDSSQLMGIRYQVAEGEFRPGPTTLILPNVAHFAVSQDAQKFLYWVPVSTPPTPQINITTNWFEELKRLVPTDN